MKAEAENKKYIDDAINEATRSGRDYLILEDFRLYPADAVYLANKLEKTPSITKLTVRLGRRIGAEGAKALAALTSITKLDLSGCEIGDEGAKALAANTSITHLDLSGCRIGDEGAKALAANTSITHLDLSSNQILAEGAKALAANKTITHLDLSFNKGLVPDRIYPNESGDRAFKPNEPIKMKKYTAMGDEGAKAFAANTSIVKLNLAGNDIGNEGAIQLAANNIVRNLDLSTNNIGDEGALAFAANQTITSLSLRHNNVSNDSVREFMKNNTLTSLDLTENGKIGPHLLQQLGSHIENNQKAAGRSGRG